MFTIKWVAGNGCQHLYAGVLNVDYTPAAENAVTAKAQVAFEIPGPNVTCTIESGRVYVMNDEGRTVERYVLEGDAEFQHGLAPAS